MHPYVNHVLMLGSSPASYPMGRSLLVLQLIGQPIEALVEAVPTGGAGGLDVPVAVAEGVQTQLVRDLGSVHGIRQILSREEELDEVNGIDPANP